MMKIVWGIADLIVVAMVLVWPWYMLLCIEDNEEERKWGCIEENEEEIKWGCAVSCVMCVFNII